MEVVAIVHEIFYFLAKFSGSKLYETNQHKLVAQRSKKKQKMDKISTIKLRADLRGKNFRQRKTRSWQYYVAVKKQDLGKISVKKQPCDYTIHQKLKIQKHPKARYSMKS